MAKKTKPAVQPPAPTPAPAAPTAAPPTPTPTVASSPAMALITTTANGSNHGTKVDLQAVYQSVVHGLQTFYLPTDVFQMTSGTYTRDELVGEFQQFVSAAQATKVSNQQWRADVQTERALELHVRELRSGVQGIAAARFGASGAPMLQFGFLLAKPRKKSAETKAVAVAKGQATRKERGTLGKVQKKDIKGNVNVAIVVTPGTDGSQVAPPAGAQPVAGGAATQAALPAAAPAVGNGGTPVATAAAPVAAVPAGGGVAPGPGVAGH